MTEVPSAAAAAGDGESPPADLCEPADTSFQSPGEPEREKREVPGVRRRTRRRAARSGTNPSAQDLPDVVPPREAPPAGEAEHDRWLREQRPPHWE